MKTQAKLKKAKTAVPVASKKKPVASKATVGKTAKKVPVSTKTAKKAPPTVAKKSAAPVKGVKAKTKVKAAAAKPLTKTQMLQTVADMAELPLRDTKAIMNAFEDLVLDSVSPKNGGQFMLSGLFKITAQHVPAKKARRGINPFTGEETTFKAKPATVKLKIRPLTKLKQAAL